MSSCDASDVQIKTQSPPYRRAREARRDTVNESYCEAEHKGLARCPPDYCRCSGELRRKVVTVDHPWGAPEHDQKKWNPPDWSKEKMEAELKAAAGSRKNARGSVVPSLQAMIGVMKSNRTALGEDEAERLAELEEWLACLQKE